MKATLFVLMLSITAMTPLKSQVADAPENICPMLIGETIPDAVLIDAAGERFSLKKILSSKPTVLVIYRGGWCPYCNIHLSALANSEDEIISLGYQIVAISPDDYKQLVPAIEEAGAKYKVYSDPGANLIQKLGLGFRTTEDAKQYIEKKNKEIASEIMPVPSLMVVDTDSKILFEYINPDYKTRISEKMLVAVLKNL